MNPRGSEFDRLMRRLAGRRVFARSAIMFERVWPALWPALGVAGLFICAALLDLPRLLPPWWHIGLLAVTAAAIMALLVRGLHGIAVPDDKAADRRLEVASGLAHRPLAVLTDRPSRGRAGPDTAAMALWQAHVARAARQVRRLRIGLPRPGLARQDPRALRAALVVALIAAFAIAGDDASSRLAQAVEPTLPREVSPPATELQAWITPPAYTRLAPIFLRADGGTVSVPSGARLTVSVTGGNGTPTLLLDSHAEPFRQIDKASFQADRELAQGGRLTVRRNGVELAAWNLAVIADQPPVAEWSDTPSRAPGSQQTRLPWRVSDDYGVVSLQAELRLRDRRDAPPLVVSLPLPGGTPKSAHGTSQQDLTAHPWAGLPVIARLVARDALSQTGESREAEFLLPQRPFQNPVARALMAIRRDLSLRPDDRESAVNGLDPLLMAPEALGADYGAYMNLGANLLPARAQQGARGGRRVAAAHVGSGAAPRGGPDRTHSARAGRSPPGGPRCTGQGDPRTERCQSRGSGQAAEGARGGGRTAPAGADGAGEAQQRRDAVRSGGAAHVQTGHGQDGGAGARGRTRGAHAGCATAHGGTGAHAGQAAQRTRRARARRRADRGPAPARAPADGRGAGHDRPAGRRARSLAESRADENYALPRQPAANPAGGRERRSARRTGGCSRRFVARSAN